MATDIGQRSGGALDRDPPGLAGAVNREWRRDCGRPAPVEWRGDGRLSAFGTLSDAVAALDGRDNPDRAEEVLAALWERSSEGDHAAARVVVQYQLPGILWLAAHGSPAGFRFRWEALDELVTAAWEAALGGPPARRRTSLRRSLFYAVRWRGVERAASRARRRWRNEQSVGDWGDEHENVPEHPAAPHPAVRVVEALSDAVAAGAITRDEARIVGSLSVGGLTCKRLGKAEGLAASTVSQRRVAAVRRLAEWAAGDDGDADGPE